MHPAATIVIAIPIAVAIIGMLSFATVLLMILGGLAEPTLEYAICSIEPLLNGSEPFLFLIEALTDAKVNRNCSFEVLTNGDFFYESQLACIRNARKSVHLEAYIFDRGEIGQKYIEALAERARAGVEIRVVCDAFGSMGVNDAYFAELLLAGGVVA